MKTLDSYPVEIRLLVHEYGPNIVQKFMKCGVVKPAVLADLLSFSRDAFRRY